MANSNGGKKSCGKPKMTQLNQIYSQNIRMLTIWFVSWYLSRIVFFKVISLALFIGSHFGVGWNNIWRLWFAGYFFDTYNNKNYVVRVIKYPISTLDQTNHSFHPMDVINGYAVCCCGLTKPNTNSNYKQ